jgi:regulator of sigma E protease
MASLLSSPFSILVFIVALGTLLFVHEFGHFIASKLFKIKVEEFGFGLPPRMIRLFRLGETDFTLNWIPFGAFVKPQGETDPNVPGGLSSSSLFTRFCVFFGGPLMNLIVGILLFTIIFSQTGIADHVLVGSVTENTPAAQAGLQVEDVLLEVNQIQITSSDTLLSIVYQNVGTEVSIKVLRNNQELIIKAIPRKYPPAGQGPLGIGLKSTRVPVTIFQAVTAAFTAVGDQIYQFVTLPAKLIKGQISPNEARIVGPVGMYTMFNYAVTSDIEIASTPNSPIPPIITLNLLAVISVALGITNLLPLPGLDGGHIIFLIPELIFRRRVPQEKENLVHFIGLAALIILMVFIVYQDVINPIILP